MNNNLIKTVLHKDYKIKIYVDDSPESPRKWDNLGIMNCFHNNYKFGDNHNYNNLNELIIELWEKYASDEEKIKYLQKQYYIDSEYINNSNVYEHFLVLKHELKYDNEDDKFQYPEDVPSAIVSLDLYFYPDDFTLRTIPNYNNKKVGIIYITPEQLKKEYESIIETKEEIYEKAISCLESEILIYNQYLNGEIYGYAIEDKYGNNIDSCYGFYGEDFEESGLLNNAIELIEALEK